MKTSFYSQEELASIGLKTFGDNVFISRKASFYGAESISLGNNVRIDDYCILSGHVEIGSFVHISAFCALYGSQGIIIKDFSGTSAKVIIYSAIDDFSGDFLIGPMVPPELTNVIGGPVILNRYVQIGAGCVIFPNLEVGEGAVVGAMSLVNGSLAEWTINVGIPARFLKPRQKTILKLKESLYNCFEKK